MTNNKKKKVQTTEDAKVKGFLDMIAPSIIQFYTDHYICGNTFRCVWALREYPTATDEQAILRYLGEMDGVTLRIYTRQVTPAEEKRIISNAANKNRMKQGNTENLQETVTAAHNLQDVTDIIASMHRNREPLLHTAVYLELSAPDMDKLKMLQTEVLTELIRSKLNVDKLLLRQKQGFVCVHPAGRNVFLDQFERVLPASSVANLFPFNYSGKTDPQGFYIGRDKFGSNVIVDFNRRAVDKTNANILILGNSGQGKSYLLKLIQTIFRESGMKVICLDPEHEYVELTENMGGCFVDLMSGEYIINVLEPKTWDENGSPEDAEAPEAFRCLSRLSQHISFLKDFFRSYKNFTDNQIDTIEIMLEKLYEKWNIRDNTDFGELTPEDYPILSDLYDLMEEEYKHYDPKKKQLYTAELLQEICLGLHSMCKGAESKFFNGYTNITDAAYQLARLYIRQETQKLREDPDATPDYEKIIKAVKWLEEAARQENPFADYALGRLNKEGVLLEKDMEKAVFHLQRAADAGNSFAQYQLGKIYLDEEYKNIPAAVQYLTLAANQKNELAAYRLGRLYLIGEDLPKNIERALYYLDMSAEAGNQYAQYVLGKLYLIGKEVEQDREKAYEYFSRSAEQGNIYAAYFLEHWNDMPHPDLLLMATRLMHHLGNAIEENMDGGKKGGNRQRMDRKLARKIRQKKIAQGHAEDDREQEMM